MSGHSKWANIKNKKGVADKRRGKLFSQLSKNIRIAVKEGRSGDPAQNASLRLALEKAKAANMPAENIKRAIDRGSGIGKGGQVEEVIYEGYGPHGVAFIIMAITDNKMRTASEMRILFNKHQGSLGGPGSAAFMFERAGSEYKVSIPLEIADEIQKNEIEALEEALHEHDDVEDVFHTAVF
ncbi:MAG: YebC/PmpR family DNA-binding transcriptional regulator [Patescibacteria group bacterium]